MRKIIVLALYVILGFTAMKVNCYDDDEKIKSVLIYSMLWSTQTYEDLEPETLINAPKKKVH